MDTLAAIGKVSVVAQSKYRPHQMTMTQRNIKTRKKKRKELLLVQLCFVGGTLLLVSALSYFARNPGSGVIRSTVDDNDEVQGGRRLLQMSDHLNATENEEAVKNCTAPAIHEFPEDLFTNRERADGALALHVLCAVYMFCALALVCDDYFVPSLEKICERLHLSEDVAGATFMAAGSSAPELFTSIIGVFITKGDVGVGTIVGSAVFNILCIIGVCGFFAGQAVRLSHWTLLRDSAFYTLSIAALIAFIHDEEVSWVESLVLILMYLVYILIMKFNSRVQRYFERGRRCTRSLANGTAGSGDVEENMHDSSIVLLKRANAHCRPSVLMVDELLCAYPHRFSLSEAGMRVMITNHFSPRTRLSMASRMLISERQRLINTRLCSAGDAEMQAGIAERRSLENGVGVAERSANGRCHCERRREEEGRGKETGNENEDNENNENDGEEEGEGDEGPFVPFAVPAGVCSKLKWLGLWPLCFLLYFTVPNCAKPRWENWFMITFLTATLWIAGLSYIMVWMVTVIGYTLGIPDVIMGITFLAAGTSVPDCMASLIVARQGMGDMAISNSIGSNVFDILVGLGLPWVLQTLAIDYGSTIHLNSRGLVFSVGLLLASVFFAVLGVHLNHWTLNRKLGSACLLLYAVFLCFSILIEFNVFTFVNLPMCQDDL